MQRSMRIAFLFTEALLYSAFLFLDLFTDADTTWLKYASILLVALMSLRAKERLITCALCLTAAADAFLLVLDRWYAAGILLFLIVQLLYSLRLESKRALYAQLILMILSVLFVISGKRLEPLAAGYILIFLINLIHAVWRAAQSRSKVAILFFLGLLLFFCCDLCVGYYHIGSGALWAFARIAMWGFYLPGQILILLSAKTNQGDPL